MRQLDDGASVDAYVVGQGGAGEGQGVVAQREPAVVAITPVRREQWTSCGGCRVGRVIAKCCRCHPLKIGWRGLAQIAPGP